MIPLKDDNPTSSRPIVTYLLIGLCILIFFRGTFSGNHCISTKCTFKEQFHDIHHAVNTVDGYREPNIKYKRLITFILVQTVKHYFFFAQ